MLTILFKILGILGILLLVLLGIALTVILLVLFFPLCYKASGQKSADEMRFSVKVRWLFGLVRIFYDYPQPGKLLAKVLFFTVYDSSNERKEKKNVSTGKSSKKAVVPPTTEIPQEAVPSASDPQPSVKEPIPEQKSTKERGFFNKIRYTVGKICDKIISYSGSSADADERCGKITGLGRELQEMKLWKQHRRKTNMK